MREQWIPPEHIRVTKKGLDGIRDYAERYAHTKRDANEWIIVLCDEIEAQQRELERRTNLQDIWTELEQMRLLIGELVPDDE